MLEHPRVGIISNAKVVKNILLDSQNDSIYFGVF